MSKRIQNVFLLLAVLLCGELAGVSVADWADAAPHNFKVSRTKRPACRDRRDNDGDGLTDYPSDPGCRSKRDRTERNPSSNNPGSGASLNGRLPFPNDNPWNVDISELPVDPNSDAIIASMGGSDPLFPAFGTVWDGAPNGIPYVVVNGDQGRVPVSFDYDEESDSGPYPIPSDAPIEGGAQGSGDRHILVIDQTNWILYELFYAFPLAGGGFHAGSGAIFDLNSNDLRPQGWTSADAAGLPIFPGLVRYDEVAELGEIRHALRFTAQRTRRAYVHPARHYASSLRDSNLPPMGMRARLKASVDISQFSPRIQVILRALKRYGMFMADNGSDWFLSGAPDPRWDNDELHTMKAIKGRDFEVVEMGQIITE